MMMTTNNTSTDPDFLFSPLPTQRIITNFASSSSPEANYHQSSRKKRSKLIKIDGSPTSSCSAGVSKPKYAKKPDPTAPKITRPCTECGKKFWSWKALFGHMRCHPERQWRGINPPPIVRRPVSPVKEVITSVENVMTLEEHEVAACLLMLANLDDGVCTTTTTTTTTTSTTQQGAVQVQDINEVTLVGGVSCRFECNSCKKVFGSHQALGGHRASHKNVKGCFAITRGGVGGGDDDGYEIDHHDQCSDEIVKENVDDDERKMMMMVLEGHKCSICLKVFSSGQALGGHKRCHWEKGDDDEPLLNQGLALLDLNMPAPVDDDSASSGLTLDLRLGL